MNRKKIIILTFIISILTPFTQIMCQDEAKTQPLPSEQTLETILRLDEEPAEFSQDQIYKDMAYLIVYLLVFIVVIYGATLFLRRILYPSASSKVNSSADFFVEESLSLSATSTLHIVKARGQTLLIGETPHNIKKLSDFPNL